MPVHDWTRVDAGIFHAFHHGWITELARALNRGLLPSEYYALPEQHAAGFGTDVLTLALADGTTATVHLTPNTRYSFRGRILSPPVDLNVGLRVRVASKQQSDGTLLAQTITILSS